MNLNLIKKLKQAFVPLLLIFAAATLSACHPAAPEAETETEVRTPVKTTGIFTHAMDENIELRATSQFQKKVSIKANATGYIDNVTVNIGDHVTVGQTLFSIKTKEANAISMQSSGMDSTLRFSGLITIKAQKDGIITTIDHQKGDYVQDGDQLGMISDGNSLVFILDVPFELHQYMKTGSECTIIFPDNLVSKGIIRSALPTVDALSQTQSYIVALTAKMPLPENLIVKVRIAKSTKPNAQVLKKYALLADETQTEFWVMKLINDSTAIKVPVKKGIENDDEVEILEPQFSTTDRIIFSGNYGLADTAKVLIESDTARN